MRKLISLAAVTVLASASAATAQSLVFGVDFGSGPTYSGTGVLGETFSGAIGTEHIAYSNGQDTGVTVNLNGPLGGSAGAFDAPGDGSNALFEDGVAIGNRGPAPGQTNLDYEIQAVLAGLAPNTTYNVAVYAGSDGNLYSAAGSSQIVDFGSGGSNDVIQTITENTSTPNYRSDFILGEDYALSTETTDGNGDLTFSVQGENSADPILNGFGISLATTVSGTPTWLTNGSGDWNSANNWGGTVPNGIDAQASFLGAITANSVVYTTTPITVGTLTFNNSAASYSITGAVGASLTFQVSSGSALVDVQAGTHELNLPLILASNTTFQTDAPSASLIIGNPITINPGITLTTTGTGTVTYESTITLQSGAAMSIASSTYAHALSLAAGSTVFLPAGVSGSKTLLQLDSLTDAGTLDLNNNDLIIHGGSLAAVTAGVASGYNGGTWTGAGITSSSAADDPTHLHALGIMAATTAGTFEGAAVAAGDVLVKYTYYGDANLDGQVDASDYSLIDNGYLNHLTGWSNGDFNYDGVVNGSDYTLIDNAFNMQGAQISTEVAAATDQISSVSAVPEPLTSSLLAFGAVCFLGRRRRSH